MKSPTLRVEEALLLMSGGFFVHLINASRHVRDVGSQVADVVLRPVDRALFLLKAYCAVALAVGSREFARTYDLTTTGRALGYWAITAYVTVSLPGHILLLATGDTGFFDAFPWWFSVVILPVYVLVVVYVLAPRQRQADTPSAAAGQRRGSQTAAERSLARARHQPSRQGVSA